MADRKTKNKLYLFAYFVVFMTAFFLLSMWLEKQAESPPTKEISHERLEEECRSVEVGRPVGEIAFKAFANNRETRYDPNTGQGTIILWIMESPSDILPTGWACSIEHQDDVVTSVRWRNYEGRTLN